MKTTTNKLQDLMNANTNVSLAKLADAVNAPYAAIRAKAKQPVEGQPYDSAAINYNAIEAYLLKRNPELDLEKLDWSGLNEKTERQTKVLKDSNVDFSVGKTYWLRYYKANWTIVYETETHLCIMPTDGGTQPKVMAKTTFVACGVKPAQVEASSKVEESKGA